MVNPIIKSTLRNLIIVIIAFLLAYKLGNPIWDFYDSYFHEPSSWINLNVVIGLMFGYILFYPFFLGIFGDKNWTYWLGLFWAPVALFELYIGLHQIIFSLSFVLVSLLLGISLALLREKFWNSLSSETNLRQTNSSQIKK